jgi:hypothetical protein
MQADRRFSQTHLRHLSWTIIQAALIAAAFGSIGLVIAEPLWR